MVFTAFVAFPDGDGDTPVSLTGYTPVAGIGYEIMESGASRPFGIPFDLRNLGEKLFLNLWDRNEPLLSGAADDGRLASPAVTVAVGNLHSAQEEVAERLNNLIVGIADVKPRENAGILGEVSRSVDGAEDLKFFADADKVVVPAVSGCDMDKSRIVKLYVVGKHNPVVYSLLNRHRLFKRRVILDARNLGTRLRLKDFEVRVSSFL